MAWQTCIFNSNKLYDRTCRCEYHTWLFSTRFNESVNTTPKETLVNEKKRTALLKLPSCSHILKNATYNPVSPLYHKKKINVKKHSRDEGLVSTSGSEEDDSDDSSDYDGYSALFDTYLKQRQKKRRIIQHENGYDSVYSSDSDECSELYRNAYNGSTSQPDDDDEEEDSGVLRLSRFLEVMKILGEEPSKNIIFSENEKMIYRLIASHLKLIVGAKFWEKEKGVLYKMLSVYEDFSSIQNVLWITNRQQGKTSTLAKFLACMSFMSPMGGTLFCVYAYNLTRAQELTDGAKDYLYWIIHDKTVQQRLLDLGLKIPVITKNNERTFIVSGQYGHVYNKIRACPQNADSNRGDAPHACLFDEIAFVTQTFWFKFAMPLLQKHGRVFTCVTTPAPPTSFFADFVKSVKKRNMDNDFFFTLINHSLVCAACEEAEQAEKCVHKLGLIPPWKSALKFKLMLRLIPAKKMKDFEAEVYGIIRPEGGAFFPEKLVDAVFLKQPYYTKNPFHTRVSHIFICIDPASHDRSSMGMCALTYGPEGQLIYIGLASVEAKNCDILQMEMVTAHFIAKLNEHPWIRQRRNSSKFVLHPIIECNNNGIMARSLLVCIQNMSMTKNFILSDPFTKTYFPTEIEEHLGVFTTERNKLACIQQLYGALFEGRVFIAEKCVVVGESFLPSYVPPTLLAVKTLAGTQLKNFRTKENGKITGKTGSDEDDLGMAMMMASFWSHCIRAAMAHGATIYDVR